jgi:hypothetical protein
MSEERKYASLKAIEIELLKLDMPRLIRQLEGFAKFKLYNHEESVASDIVSDVFDKLLTYNRKWYEGDCLEVTLFGAVKSLCNNYNNKLQKSYAAKVSNIEIEEVVDRKQLLVTEEMKYDELRKLALKILKEHDPPPDYLEELIFECWMEGLIKQKEVAEYLEQDITEIRKGVKRLKRKLGPIQEQFRKIGYGQK